MGNCVNVSFRLYLIGLVSAVLLPVMVFAGYLGVVSAREQRLTIQNGMQETARALSLAVDRQVGIAAASLEALISSAAFRRGDYTGFRGETEGFLAAYPGWLSIIDEAGQQLMNTRLPPDAALPRSDNVTWLAQVFGTDHIFISGAVTGPVVKSPFVAISRRVQRLDGKTVVLTLSISPDQLSKLLLEQSLPAAWFGVIADRAGLIIGRTSNLELVGRPMTILPKPPSGFAKATTHEGAPVYIAWSTSAQSGWSTGVAAPVGLVDSVLWWAVGRTTLLGLGALLLAITAAFYFGERLAGPVTALALAVNNATDAGPAASVERFSGITEVDELASAFARKIEELTVAIAARDAAQRDLKSLNDELEERIQRRSLELEKLNELLLQTQKQESLGRLTGGIAHDFNNLLAAIIGNLELLSRRAKDSGLSKFINNARTAAERGAHVTNQLLAFARNQRLETKSVPINVCVQRLHELLGSTLGGTIQIELLLAAEQPLAMADPTQLDLILLNLAVNARDAMPMGGILTIETRTDLFGLRERPEEPSPGKYVIVAISDTGIGMTDEVRAQAFEPFFTTKGVGKGSGLGLPHVLGVAKQLGGGIRIRSRPGEGTRVELYLPEGNASPNADATPSRAGATQTFAGARVLLTDDDPDVRAATAEMLRELGCDVLEAGSGGGALDLLAHKRNIDLAMIDYAMPGLNGVETARQLSDMHLDLPCILISGYADTDKLRLHWHGPVLRKPFGLAELAAALSRHLRSVDNVIEFPSG
jgi:signal transduction histidine kinase